MKKYKQLFQDAERLVPPPDLWRRIEAEVEMRSGDRADAGFSWGSPSLRMAASIVLAVGVLGLGLFLKHGNKPAESIAQVAQAAAAAAPAGSAAVAESGDAEQMDLVDPELLGWHADLGDVDDLEADEAEEVL